MEIPINKKKIPDPATGFKRVPYTGGNIANGLANKKPLNAFAPKVAQPAPNEQADAATMKVVEYIVKAAIYMMIFFFPLFFMVNVPSVLELNKQFIMVVLVGIGFLAWIGKMAWKNEIRFKKNFILVPIITFVAIVGISSFASVYSDQSIWGYFGGESKSFISLLFFVALFFLISNNIQSRKEAIKLLIVFLISGLLVSVYGLMQIFETYVLPVEATKNNFFNTIGSVYLFAVYVAALLLVTISLFLDRISKIFKIALIALSFYFFFILMVVNFAHIWKGLIAALALILGSAIIKSKPNENQSRILPMVFIVLALLMALREQPIVRKAMPVEILLNYETSAKIALSSLKENPILGVGPGMYVNVYEKNRPDNLGTFWSVNFNDATSYFLTLSSTTGILGTLAFIFLVGTGLIYLWKVTAKAVSSQGDSDFMVIGTGATWLFLTVMQFIYLANMSIMMLWWLSFALFISFVLFDPAAKAKEFVTSSQSPRSSLTLSFVFVLVIIGFITAIYVQSQKYIAAVHFNKALVADQKGENIDSVAAELEEAVNIDPKRDIYYRNFSIALFAQANQRVSEKQQELSSEDTTYISMKIKGALQMADRAVSLNPNDPENYVALARVYEGVIATMDQADDKAIENYEKAIQFDPNNPALHLKLASIYVALADIEASKQKQDQKGSATGLPQASKDYLSKARVSLDEALRIKKDYADANLLMASIYEREGNLAMAIEKEKENKSLYPQAPGVAFRLGLLYYKNNQMDEAKKEFEYAINLDNKYSNARYFLGLILDKQKDKNGAIQQFEKIAEFNPDNESVQKILANLKSGKDALAGMGQTAEKETPISEQNNNQGQQPTINPPVENQPIPEEATPSPEDMEEQPENP